jgi:hypothetical protein
MPILPQAGPDALLRLPAASLGVEPPRTVTMHIPVDRSEIDAAVARLSRSLGAALDASGSGH